MNTIFPLKNHIEFDPVIFSVPSWGTDFDYGNDLSACKSDTIATTEIRLNTIVRIEEMPSEYFQSVEPLSVHDNTPFSFTNLI